MKIHLIEHGEISTVLVRAESGRWSFESKSGTEVRLTFPENSAELFVRCAGRGDAAEPADDASRRRIQSMRETSPAFIAWIASGESDPTAELAIQVHRFQTAFRFEPMAIGVDERAAERVSRFLRREVPLAEACEWLANELTLPAIADREPRRAIATGSPSKGERRFRLLGGRVAADIVPRGDVYLVDAVVGIKGNRQGFRPPEFLIECDIGFDDATATGALRKAVRSQLDQIVAETDSYLGLWGRYQQIERENLVRRARAMGWVDYESFRTLPSGLWSLTAKDREALRTFQESVGESERLEVEAAERPPAELLGDVESRPEARAPARVAVGNIESIQLATGEVLVRPIDEDSDVLPPKRGVFFAAMQGDRTRLQRREAAAARIRSADALLPELGLLIENKPVRVRRGDRVKALSRAARRAFEHEPTPAQKDAIDVALNTPDIAVIQGPPGTGKTTVLAAIQVRLAEMEAASESISGRTLLTSFQHDAVDHAAGMSLVYSLPPLRFGGRDRARERDERVARWADKQRDHVQAQLASLPEERPLSLYRSVRDQVASCAAGALSSDEVESIVDQLAALPSDHLPTDVWERLRVAKERFGRVPHTGDDLARELRLSTIKGIRATNDAFADDGPRAAHFALRRLGALLSDDERRLLEAAAASEPGKPFVRIDELAALRDRLLDRTIIDEVPGESPRPDREIVETLNAAVRALGERVRRTPGGVADTLQEFADALEFDPLGLHVTLRHYASVYAATCQQSVGHHLVTTMGGDDRDVEFENVIVDEAARANPLDLFIPMSLARRRIILVGDHRQLPHMLEPDVERELSTTATEATRKAMKESLFQRLFEELEARQAHDGVRRVVTLDQQFRMHPTLGAFVCRTFYGETEAFSSPRPAEEFAHDLTTYRKPDAVGKHSVCAAWHDIPDDAGAEHAGRSKSRPAEARWIAKETARLLRESKASLSIGVITFYRAQLAAIHDALIVEGICERDADSGETVIRDEFRTIERDGGRREEWLRVGTVDAFQGKEFDVVLLSATRSNRLPGGTPEQQRRKFGHLLLANRLCVAMSRARKLLIVVGDREMFETDVARVAVPGLASFLELCGGDDGIVS